MAKDKAPQKQCRLRSQHIAHHWTRPDGLVCWCQGRGGIAAGGGGG